MGTGHNFSAKALADIALIALRQRQGAPYDYQETVSALEGRIIFHFWISHPMPESGEASERV